MSYINPNLVLLNVVKVHFANLRNWMGCPKLPGLTKHILKQLDIEKKGFYIMLLVTYILCVSNIHFVGKL